jgi:membrane protease YdiL (CAAX protease family)
LQLAFTIIVFFPAFGEEWGWRGYMMPKLLKLMPKWAAVLLGGVIWGLWHAPIIAMGHNYGMDYAGFPIAGILVMMLTCTAFGSWLAVLRLRTGSVWPCALAHGAFNAVAGLGSVFCIGGVDVFGPSPLALVAGIPLVVLGVVCIVRIGRISKDEAAKLNP